MSRPKQWGCVWDKKDKISALLKLNSNSCWWKEDFVVEFLLRYRIRLIANPKQISSVCLQSWSGPVFDAQVDLPPVSSHVASAEWKAIEIRNGMVSFYGHSFKILLKAKGLWQAAFDILQDYNSKGGWKDIKETKITLSTELKRPCFFITGVFLLCCPLTFIVTA